MAEYLPEVTRQIARRRIFNAESLGIHTIVTASPSENLSLKGASPEGFTVLSLEDLILE